MFFDVALSLVAFFAARSLTTERGIWIITRAGFSLGIAATPSLRIVEPKGKTRQIGGNRTIARRFSAAIGRLTVVFTSFNKR